MSRGEDPDLTLYENSAAHNDFALDDAVQDETAHGDTRSNLSFDIDAEDPEADQTRVGDEIGLLGQPSAHLKGIFDESKKSNLRMAFMNMANSIIGAGIIGQAYAVRQAGLMGGILLLLGLTVVIDWTIRLMVTNSKLSGMRTYQATVKYCFGRPGAIAVSLAQGLFAFGGSMAYCIIIGDTIPKVIRGIFPSIESHNILSVLSGRVAVMIYCVMFVSYPLALNRNIAALAKASALALVSMLVITLTVAIRGPLVKPADAHMSKSLWTFNSGFFQAISVISFAFVCHHNTLLIYDSLKTPTLNRFAVVVHWSTGVSMLCCIILGIGGFLSFQDKTLGNVLNNFPNKDIMANVARFCFGFNMITTLPLEIFVCREVILEALFPHQEKSSTIQHVFTTTALILAALVVSMLTCDLGIILELVGASTACTMAYVFPPLCFIKLSSKPRSHPQKLICYACVVFGILVLILSSAMTLRNLGKGEHHKCGA